MGLAQVISMLLNVAIAVMSVRAWLWLVFGTGGRLADTGWHSLKYFTVLSNLFSALVSAVYVVVCALGWAVPTWLVVAKLVAASCVMVTFWTVVALLNPMYGAKAMYAGGNLWLHAVLPLLAALDCCLFVPLDTLPMVATGWAMLPVFLYGCCYLQYALSTKDDQERKRRDFYGFLRWGVDRVPVTFAVMLFVAWTLAALMRATSVLVGVV